MIAARLLSSRRIRATPYHRRVEQHGVSGFTVVNHTLLPKGFQRSVEEDYWHLREHVQLWDVGCQRQVEITGSDAARLVQLMTPRDLRSAQSGQCFYAPLTDRNGGIINDPVILKLATDRFWLSIADSDVLLWALGLAEGMDLDVAIEEPDVWPMAVQGPKSDALMARVFGNEVSEISFFRFAMLPFDGHPLLVARSGFSTQGGFEIYLDRPVLAEALWDALWQEGASLNVAPGCPNLIERIEAGLLSYGNDMTRDNNPLECGMSRFCQLDGSVDFVGIAALRKIADTGPKQRIVGARFGTTPCGTCSRPWPIMLDGAEVGQVTSAIWSPRFASNVAIAMMSSTVDASACDLTVAADQGERDELRIVPLPMQ